MHMDFDFKLVPNDKSVTRVMDALSITRTRQIGLSSYIINKYSLRQYKRAQLYWDKRNMTIAFVFTKEDLNDAYIVDLRHKVGGGIKCGAFFSANGLNVEELAGRYDYKVLPAIDLGIPKAGDAFIMRLDSVRKPTKG